MSMKPELENFHVLRRLLRLKRYEQPPPGYFAGFSRQVIARIEAGESGEAPSVFRQLFGSPSWLRDVWASFGARPILAGAFGITICTVLIAGMAYSDRDIPGAAPSRPDQSGFAQIAPSIGLESPAAGVPAPAGANVLPAQEGTSLFQEIQRPKADLIMYSVQGN
jgi:hypothetical protein